MFTLFSSVTSTTLYSQDTIPMKKLLCAVVCMTVAACDAPCGTEPFSFGAVPDVTDLSPFIESDSPIVVVFHAKWCGPCRRLAPEVERWPSRFPGTHVVRVDIDKSPHLARFYGVTSIPRVLVRPADRAAKFSECDPTQAAISRAIFRKGDK